MGSKIQLCQFLFGDSQNVNGVILWVNHAKNLGGGIGSLRLKKI